MSEEIKVVYAELSAQRQALDIASRDLGSAMETAHGSETGVQAPVGRTGLRESLEGVIGAVRAQLRLYEDEVSTVSSRLIAIETSTKELDVSLGAGWERLDQ